MSECGKAAGSNPASDADISAWLDGGLDKDGMTRMDKLVATDSEIAMKADRMRHLDGLVRAAVPLEEALPEGMLERLGLAAPAGAEVVDLAAVRAQRAAAAAPLAVRRTPLWLSRVAAGLALTVAVGIGLGPMLRHQEGNKAAQPAEYTALGDAVRTVPNGMPANAVAVFAAGVPAARVQAIIGEAGVRIVAGPTATGVWQLAITPGRREAALATLRRHTEVTLAEPLDGVPQ